LKIFFYIPLLLLLSCKKEIKTAPIIKKAKKHDGYTIKGTITSDATKIYLLDSILKVIDSSKIKEKTFVLKGKLKKPEVCFLQLNNNKAKHTIVLENTYYNLLIKDENHMIIGGDLNSELTNYLYSKEAIYNKASKYYEQYTFKDISLKTYLKKVDSLQEIKDTSFTKFVLNNKDNLLSALVINQTKLSSSKVIALKKQIDDDKNSSFLNRLDTLITELKIEEAEKKLSQRKIAPLFSAVNLLGSRSSLKSLMRGKKLFLIDFWASWCPPCRESSPKIIALYKKYHKKGYDVLTVSEDRSVTDWKNGVFIDDLERWHHVYDDYNRISSLYGVTSLPHLVLIDENGKIIKNKISLKDLEKTLKQFFKE